MKGTEMKYEHIYYLTSDRTLDIEFLFVEIAPSEWRIYILSDIPYGSRSSGSNDVHRLVENDQTRINLIKRFMSMTRSTVPDGPIYYICWSEKIVEANVKPIARAWSEITSYYLKHGGNFPDIWNTLKAANIL